MQVETYYFKNKEERLAYQRQYYLNNKEQHLERSKQYLLKNPIACLYKSSKNAAKRRGLEFTIKKEDIFVPKYCPLLGAELTFIQGKGRIPTNISIDRIDNTKGYIPGNVWIISELANRMKSNATRKELIEFSKNILKMFGTE